MSVERVPGALPVPVSSFVGRERQLADVGALLTRCRLVTLTGAGGCGKTRLALEVAHRQRDRFEDGVGLVPLATLGDPSFVAPAVGRALGLPEAPGRSHREAVALALRDRELLLVLDNFEHLLDAAPLVAEWLMACPGLTVLVTSRERLRLQGEQLYPVPPLSLAVPLPQRANGGTATRLPTPLTPVASPASPVPEAVQLFVDRARAVQPGFALVERSAPAVAEICRRLDGLPLAIELVAAQVSLLPPATMLARLDRRPQLVAVGPRDLPARQRTLRDTIAWSHDLLSEDERKLFRWLAVFAGGWTLEAATAVCGFPVLDGLASLADKSLVFRLAPSADEPRYGMLETIRDYIIERLAEHGEEAAARRAHADYFLGLAEHAAPELEGPEQAAGLDRLEEERANLGAVARWAIGREDGEMMLRLSAALWRFWWARNSGEESRAWWPRAGPTARLLRRWW